MNVIGKDILQHYGMPRRSGRYPWGSGKNPFQSGNDLLGRIDFLKKEGYKETKIAELIGLTTTQLRTQVSLAKAESRAADVAMAKKLREKGYSYPAIAKRMNYKNESSIRSLLDPESEARMNQAMATADHLRKIVDKNEMVDVGVGVELELGISKEKMKQALYILEMEGYKIYKGGIPQPTNPGQQTNRVVLCSPEKQHKDIYEYDKVASVGDYESRDGGDTFDPKWVYPESLNSTRIKIRYSEEGGSERDGLVELRRGVDDLSLGDSRYSQVRILVDDSLYIKGMAAYGDDIPKGYDLIFNTNKPKGTPIEKVLKGIKKDELNPFGASIKEGVFDPLNPDSTSKKSGQSYYIDENGKKRLSVINKHSDEGDWFNWRDGLSSQFLSKQPLPLVDKQLKLAMADKQEEYDELISYTNPTVKKVLLQSFADDCEAAAVDLQAASLPRQKYHVILPVPSLKDNEVYAPNYKNGEEVVLVRFPHGGIFEIPRLKVNNKHADSKKILGNTPTDAIAINHRVAEQLSGADFDGDSVLVIPVNNRVKISSKSPLEDLKNFDPKLQYGGKPEGTFRQMTNTQNEMGSISNLIADMTLKGANDREIAKAVKHSMVVIDAEKHKLDYKQSELDNDIRFLKNKWQKTVLPDGRVSTGVSTLLTRSKSPTAVDKRVGSPKINVKSKPWFDPKRPEGSLLYNRVKNTKGTEWYDPEKPESIYIYREPESYTNKQGKKIFRKEQTKRMYTVDDARSLISDANTPVERAYAEYANYMKALANQARKELMATPNLKYSASAKKIFAEEVRALNAALNLSLKNAPRERQAISMANSILEAKKADNPDMTAKEIKKEAHVQLVKARDKVGAARRPIDISDKQWEAIQAGAISENKLLQILNSADIDKVRERATPFPNVALSNAKIGRLKAMAASGYTSAEIAEALGISASTVSKYLN